MKNILPLSLCLVFSMMCSSLLAQKSYDLQSPNEKIKVQITIGETVEYAVSHDGDELISKSPISMTLTDGQVWGSDSKFLGVKSRTVNEEITTNLYKKNKIKDHFNEKIFRFNGFQILFRAYDDGVAYRFVANQKNEFKVKGEQAVFNFVHDGKAYIPYVALKRNGLEDQMFNSFENKYEHTAIADWDKERLAFSPLLVESVKGKKIAIAEADLLNYPGMFLYPNEVQNRSLKGMFARYPKVVQQGGHNQLQGMIKEREDFIARSDANASFPWRTLIISGEDKELANNDMIYKLATPCQLDDTSWIKPGKVAWDWWNTWNLYGVDFKSGINNKTYKYYIDFASEHGIEYVILDEGWAVNLEADLLQVVPEINLPELVEYAKSKNVDLILWAGYYAFDRDMENVCKHYSEMGIKGFKVDFMDRDDQYMVAFHERAASIAANYKLLLDFHGTYKPTGLQRTFPNVINFEAVYGLEQMKWSGKTLTQVDYDVTIPFIRQLAGPVDYTQGAMRNATKSNYRIVSSEGMSQGTRCRQLAEYVVFESPLNMLCDSPSNYEREKECTEFIANIPTVWGETVVLNGEVGKYVTIARRHGDVWYIGSMTNWDARSFDLDLTFFGEGNFKAELFKDGVNADKVARDYKKEVIDIPTNKQLNIKMAPGGGYAVKITKK